MRTAEPHPWERQPGEGDQAFQAFATYRDMGPDRSTRAVAQKLSKSASLIGRWSTQHRWVIRVEAWERENDRVRIQGHREAVEEMTRRHAECLVDQLEVLRRPAVANRIIYGLRTTTS
jgi:hypothetical protein